MKFKIDLGYTPRCPQSGIPFTEESFVRKSRQFTFDISEVGVALVDLWNFGWEDGPISERLGSELSSERGISHAHRKQKVRSSGIYDAVGNFCGNLRKKSKTFSCRLGTI